MMSMNNTPQWFALYTRPRAEKKVADNLAKKGIEHYNPLNRVMKQWSDRKKIVFEPLFTSYVFVKVTADQLHQLRKVEGVVNVVYWLNEPAVIRESEIDTIKRFLNENMNVKLEQTQVRLHDNVRILGGSFMDYEGQVLSVRKKTIRVLLPSLGFFMYADVETSNVEVLTNIPDSKEREIYTPMKMVR